MSLLRRAQRPDSGDFAVDAMLGDDVDFGRYVLALWRRGWIIVLTGILAAAAVAAVTWARSPVYRATSTLAVSGSKIGEQAAPFVSAANFRPLIENNSVAARVIEELQLAGAPHNMKPASILASLSVEEIRNSNLMRVHVELTDPSLAARIANRVSELAVEGARRLNQDEAVQARDDIQAEVDQARKQMKDAAARLEAFRRDAQIELTKEDVTALLYERGRLSDLQVEIEAERAKLARAEAELASRQRIDSLTRSIVRDDALVQIAREGSANALQGVQLKSEELNKVYQALEQIVADSRTQLAALEKRRAYLVNVRKLDASQQAKLTELYRKEAELARLETEYEVAEKSYTAIAEQYDVARLQVAARSSQLQVIDRAIEPSEPNPRHPVRLSLFALLAGATLAAILVLLAQALGDVLSRAGRA